MGSEKIRLIVQDLLGSADIKINGKRPWDIQIHNEDFYSRALSGGALALGESYMDGWWDCKAIDQFMCRILKAKLEKKIRPSLSLLYFHAKSKIINAQSKSRSKIVGEKHYDVGNELYKLMLDKRMNYSCGYWKTAKTLDDSQEAKLDLICKKLKLKPGMTLLDIGCGWGGMAKFAAEKYRVKVIGITISKEQAKLARDICKGLDIEIRLQDYRDIKEKFDRIVSIGMFEHVGYKNYREFMEVVNNCLKEDGLFLLHTIGGNLSSEFCDAWTEKYIFPNGMLPSVKQIAKASEGLFIIEDWHNFGPDYYKTLMEWHKNFNKNWDKIKDKYNERFYRMWNYYLAGYAGSFKAREMNLWQIVFSKLDSRIDEYKSVR